MNQEGVASFRKSGGRTSPRKRSEGNSKKIYSVRINFTREVKNLYEGTGGCTAQPGGRRRSSAWNAWRSHQVDLYKNRKGGSDLKKIEPTFNSSKLGGGDSGHSLRRKRAEVVRPLGKEKKLCPKSVLVGGKKRTITGSHFRTGSFGESRSMKREDK